jgi:hypothetical protein
METPGPAPAAGDERPASVRLAQAQKALERAVRHSISCDLALYAAIERQARVGDSDRAALEAEIKTHQQAVAAATKTNHGLRARVEALRSELERSPAPRADRDEGKGESESKTQATAEESKEAARTASGPARYPFFQLSRRHAAGDLLRINIQPGTPAEGSPQPGKMVRCSNGNLYWLDRADGGVHLLRPGRGPVRVKLAFPTAIPGDKLIDVVADGETLWCLGGRMKTGFWLQQVSGAAATDHYGLSVTWRASPIAVFLQNSHGDFGPLMLAPDQLVATVVDPKGNGLMCYALPKNEGPDLSPATQVHPCPDSGKVYYLDPADGSFGALTAKPKTIAVERKLDPLGTAIGGIALATAGGKDRLYVSCRDQDTIRVYDLSAKSDPVIHRLAPGTAPGALAIGPRGTVLFARSGGFGCLAPGGKAFQVPVRGGRIAPDGLVPGLGAGKLYFTEAGRPFISALVLGDLASGDTGPVVPEGPSLLAADAKCQEAAPIAGGDGEGAPAEKKRARRKRKRSPETVAAAVEAKIPAEPEPESPDGKETREAEPEAGAEAEVPLEDEGTEAEQVRSHVLFQQITKAFDHICEGHRHSDAVDPAARGPVKGQFTAALGGNRRRLSTLLVRGANHRDALVYTQYEEDKEAGDGAVEVTVIEFTAAGTVGRVRRPGTRAWSDTRRVRVVQKTRPDNRETYVASAYPIP